MSHKQHKISSLILKDVSDILQYEVKNPDIGFITVTAVEVTSDYSYAKIFVSFLDKKNVEKRFDALQRVKGFVRSSLAKKLAIYKVPELIFVLDTSHEQAEKIEKILKEIEKK